MKIKPNAQRISGWDLQTEVLYSCPKCDCSLGFYCTDEHFCHNCGQEIDWNVLLHINKEMSSKYFDGDFETRKSVIDDINNINKHTAYPYSFDLK